VQTSGVARVHSPETANFMIEVSNWTAELHNLCVKAEEQMTAVFGSLAVL
jgi:hypothetical protein